MEWMLRREMNKKTNKKKTQNCSTRILSTFAYSLMRFTTLSFLQIKVSIHFKGQTLIRTMRKTTLVMAILPNTQPFMEVMTMMMIMTQNIHEIAKLVFRLISVHSLSMYIYSQVLSSPSLLLYSLLSSRYVFPSLHLVWQEHSSLI